MSKQPPTAFQTFSRLAIMLGTLSVGSMAWFLYGPEADQLAGAINGLVSQAVELADAPAAAEPAAGDSLALAPLADAPRLEPTPGLTPLGSEDSPRQFDPAIQQASMQAPVDSAPANTADLDTLERERLTAPLLAAGATRADVTEWGLGDAVVYRATASAPVGGVAGGLEQRFDALGPTPEAAVAELAAEIRDAGIR